MEEGQYLTLRNAKVDMYKGSMRLAVNQWGVIEKAPEGTNFEVKVASLASITAYFWNNAALLVQTPFVDTACLSARFTCSTSCIVQYSEELTHEGAAGMVIFASPNEDSQVTPPWSDRHRDQLGNSMLKTPPFTAGRPEPVPSGVRAGAH